MQYLLQIFAVAKINLLSLPQRLMTSMAAVVSIAFMVFVMVGASALDRGFEKTLEGSGSKDVALLLRDGSLSEINSFVSREQQILLEDAPGIARQDGNQIMSSELIVIVDGIKKSTLTKANIPLRGVGRYAVQAREDFSIIEGRMFTPGSSEIVVGASIARLYDGFEIGNEIRMGQNTWNVVGIFQSGNGVFASELWADLGTVQNRFQRGNAAQSVRMRLMGDGALEALKSFSENDPRINLTVHNEREFFANQAEATSDLITQIGKPLTILMALGALAGALNTMYISVARRSRDIQSLRRIGFGSFPTFCGTVLEAVVLAIAGAILGGGVGYFALNGMAASTLGNNFTQIAFELSLSPVQILKAGVVAVIIGALAGILPAWQEARKPLTSG